MSEAAGQAETEQSNIGIGIFRRIGNFVSKHFVQTENPHIPSEWRQNFGWSLYVPSHQGFSSILELSAEIDRKQVVTDMVRRLEASDSEPFAPSYEDLQEIEQNRLQRD